MRILILDDDAERHAAFLKQYAGEGVEVVQAFTTLEAIAALELWRFDVVHLDHDLGEFAVGDYGQRVERTGVDVAAYIARMPVASLPGAICIHSWNPPGASRMASILAAAGIHATYRPFGPPDNAVVASMRADFEHYQKRGLPAAMPTKRLGIFGDVGPAVLRAPEAAASMSPAAFQAALDEEDGGQVGRLAHQVGVLQRDRDRVLAERDAIRVRAERAETERDQYRQVLLARHGGEPVALLAELDAARAEGDDLRARAEKAEAELAAIRDAVSNPPRAAATGLDRAPARCRDCRHRDGDVCIAFNADVRDAAVECEAREAGPRDHAEPGEVTR